MRKNFGTALISAPLLVLVALTSLSGCNGSGSNGVITPVREVLVRIATETGEWTEERAGTIHEALRKLWDRLFRREPEVFRPDTDNPLRGQMRGIYVHKIVFVETDGSSMTVELTLNNPRVRRDSVDSPWQLDPADPDLPDLIRKDFD